jgi:hypothetical protein
MPTAKERIEILDRLERGEISPEQAAQLLSQETPGEPKPPQPETAMGVLEQLERGEIDTEEAARRLSSKAAAAAQREQSHKRRESAGASSSKPRVEVFTAGETTQPKQKREWWLVPMLFGVLFTVLAALWMRADAANGIGLGFVCAWLPLGIGLILILVAVISRNGPWARMQVNSRKASGRVNFVMDMPVPVGVATTALKTVGRYVPGIDETDVDKMTEAFAEIQRTGNPIHIQANEDDDDVVDITIG